VTDLVVVADAGMLSAANLKRPRGRGVRLHRRLADHQGSYDLAEHFERHGNYFTDDAIEAPLTVVFAALAVARHLQDATDVTIKKLVRTLRPLRTVTIAIGPHAVTAQPLIATEARAILDRLPPINGPGHYACATQVRR
jgi:hypothetical protein